MTRKHRQGNDISFVTWAVKDMAFFWLNQCRIIGLNKQAAEALWDTKFPSIRCIHESIYVVPQGNYISI